MNVIYKYPVELTPSIQKFVLPEGARIVHFGMQDGIPTMWVLQSLDRQARIRHLVVVGTGHGVPENVSYHGTVLDGQWVWHLMELPYEPAG